jgi:carbonic anhydrase/acetyltransferase-like protein (isoleucine patch superfamily)
VLCARNGVAPRVAATAIVAPAAHVIGDVTIGPGTFVDYGVVIESAGPPVVLDEEVVVFAGSVIRSVGGGGRPAFPVTIGHRTLLAPGCILTGCTLGELCYIATGAMVLQGAVLGAQVRIGVGAIVHAMAHLRVGERVGMREFAVPEKSGTLITADVEQARRAVQEQDFFASTFGIPPDMPDLHEAVLQALLAEVRRWHDEPLP